MRSTNRVVSDQGKIHRPSLFEMLEARTLLAVSAGNFDVSNVPAFTPATTNIKDFKSGPMARAGQQLVGLYLEWLGDRRAGRRYSPDRSSPLMLSGNYVGITVRARGVTPDVLQTRLEAIGFKHFATNEQYAVLEGLIPVSRLRDLSQRADIATLRGVSAPKAYAAGPIFTQADRALNADDARRLYNLSGRGIRVGVLSDSVSQVNGGLSDSFANGGLPDNVVVIQDGQGGSDEGRAMLELIHQIAPDATLAFSTAFRGQQNFAENIQNLAEFGCKIIVDDVGYATEPFFQPGVISQAISEFVAQGGIYLAASGNSGINGYEIEIDPSQWVTVGRRTLLDFDPGPGIDTRMTVAGEPNPNIPVFGAGLMQWDNPYNGLVGFVTSDLDTRTYATGTNNITNVGADDNSLSSVPIETIGTGGDIEIELKHISAGFDRPTRIRILGINSAEYPDNALVASAIGHSATPDAINVGAVFFNDTPAFDDVEPLLNEDFSSSGHVTYLFDADGNRLDAPLDILKPDISGVDGSNTTFFAVDLPQFPDPANGFAQGEGTDDIYGNFTGTSAAAPNVAAVIALMLESDPSLTKDDVVEILKETALPLNGASAGEYDQQGGFGLVNAETAIGQVRAAPIAVIDESDPNPRASAFDTASFRFTQVVTGVSYNDFTLTRDNVVIPLSNVNKVISDDGKNYIITKFTTLTATAGTYELTLNPGDIRNNAGTAMEASTSITWEKLDQTVPSTPLNPVASGISSSEIQIDFDMADGNQLGFTLQRAEDPNFTINVKTRHLDADELTTVEEGLKAGKRYWFRLRAKNDLGISRYTSTFSAITLSRGEVIVDDQTPGGVTLVGNWTEQQSVPGFFGSGYLQDDNLNKGEKNVRFTPTLIGAGKYFIYARWTRSSANAASVPIDIFSGEDGKKRTTVTVNQRDTGGQGWVLLGSFDFEKGRTGAVRIRNIDTSGLVIADAIRFLPSGVLDFG